MKKTILFVLFSLVVFTAAKAQKFNELTQEQKVMKAKEFRADNQKYLKSTLGMTDVQMNDIDNVNLCYLSTLDRINRYAKDDATKDKLANAVTEARWIQLDAIMGADKHKQYSEHIKGKIKSKAAK